MQNYVCMRILSVIGLYMAVIKHEFSRKYISVNLKSLLSIEFKMIFPVEHDVIWKYNVIISVVKNLLISVFQKFETKLFWYNKIFHSLSCLYLGRITMMRLRVLRPLTQFQFNRIFTGKVSTITHLKAMKLITPKMLFWGRYLNVVAL